MHALVGPFLSISHDVTAVTTVSGEMAVVCLSRRSLASARPGPMRREFLGHQPLQDFYLFTAAPKSWLGKHDSLSITLHEFCLRYSASTDRSEDRIYASDMTRVNSCRIRRHSRKIYRKEDKKKGKRTLSVPIDGGPRPSRTECSTL